MKALALFAKKPLQLPVFTIPRKEMILYQAMKNLYLATKLTLMTILNVKCVKKGFIVVSWIKGDGIDHYPENRKKETSKRVRFETL